jgi:uncharacterized protein (TIGR03067 family)
MHRVVILLSVLLGLVPRADAGDSKQELAKLKGEWQAVRGEQNGDVQDWGDGGRHFVFEGNKLLVIHPQTGKKIDWVTVTIDAQTNPRCIDLSRKGLGTMEGIYVLDGDTLKVCFDREVKAVKARPTMLSTSSSPTLVILTFKRVK